MVRKTNIKWILNLIGNVATGQDSFQPRSFISRVTCYCCDTQTVIASWPRRHQSSARRTQILESTRETNTHYPMQFVKELRAGVLLCTPVIPSHRTLYFFICSLCNSKQITKLDKQSFRGSMWERAVLRVKHRVAKKLQSNSYGKIKKRRRRRRRRSSTDKGSTYYAVDGEVDEWWVRGPSSLCDCNIADSADETNVCTTSESYLFVTPTPTTRIPCHHHHS